MSKHRQMGDQQMDDANLEPAPGELAEPAFLKYISGLFPDGIVYPDDQDFDKNAKARAEGEMAFHFRLAQARKLVRVWRRWQAESQIRSD
jgi:hypothetical protein